MTGRLKLIIAATLVSSSMWMVFGPSVAGFVRFVQAGSPDLAALGECPLSQIYYGFVGDKLIEIRCIGGEFG